MPTRREAVQRFLLAKTHSDLAALYNPGLEVQVNVAQDGGQRVDKEFKGRQWQAWTDGTQTWKSFRVPHNAGTAPEYTDVELSFDLEAHVEAIGMTGWDWQNKVSRWVGFDFDSITGHKDAHSKKLEPEELAKIQSIASDIPWVTVRKSTGGKGIHLHVFLEPVPTETHTEHAALGRAILSRLSALTGYNFDAKVDTCGGNMWIWHRKMASTINVNGEIEGLRLIKQGGILEEPPINWRDHIDVVTSKRAKIRGIPKSENNDPNEPEAERSEADIVFDELTSQRPKTPLDDIHKRLIKYLLEDNKTGSWWDADHHMLVSHTWWLRKAHQDLGLKGIFKTIAQGEEKEYDHNCFAFPSRRGAWSVRRYGRGVAEDSAWSQDSSGFTHCYYNNDPDLHSVARAFGGLESTKGGYQFRELEVASQVIQALGANVKIPPEYVKRQTTLKTHPKDGRLIVEFERNDRDVLEGWNPDKNLWKKIFDVQTSQPMEREIGNYDDLIRHVVTEVGDDFGWVVRGEKNDWRTEPLVHVKMSLKAQGLNSKEADLLIGQSVTSAWYRVNMPFQEEYPGDRRWNKEGAQFRYKPSQDRDNLNYPNWLKVLRHLGKGLDSAVGRDPWCQVNGITSGADYLKTWIASMFQQPLEPLPYLFFYGGQNSGKSTFHEAISLLITRGYRRADAALINPQGFNAELDGAVLCVVEETNLSEKKSRTADSLARIKDWVTARQLPIHPKGRTPYHIPNSTHWVQCSNSPDFCPIFPGDTRVTMIYVDSIDPMDMVPKRTFLEHLEREACDFLAAVLVLELPPTPSRMNLPVIETDEKISASKSNRTAPEVFFEERVFNVEGEQMLFGELFDLFVEYTDPSEIVSWTKQRFGRALPPQFPKGRSRKDGQWYVGNVSVTQGIATKPKLIMLKQGVNDYLIHEGSNGNNQGNA